MSDISLKECIIACWKEKVMDILINETYERPVVRSISLKDLEEMLSSTKSQREIKRRRQDAIKRQEDLYRVIEMSKISSDKKREQRVWKAIKAAVGD